jgi:hypothetical protein
MNNLAAFPFRTVSKLADFCNCDWKGYRIAAKETETAENELLKALSNISKNRLLDADSSMVVFGSFARYEMLKGSDCDWALLIDGVVNNQHTRQARELSSAIKSVFKEPGGTGTFGNMIFSHELIHCIGGMADSNINLTIRMLLLLESRCFDVSPAKDSVVWRNVVSNILERYFEEDVHFSPKGKRRVPRFLLNDLTRYWRTICVDYAAKYRQQDGKKWALRNAKIRFSRKLLYAAGLAFCLSCELAPPREVHKDLFGLHPDNSARPFIESALQFALTPPLEYLAAFIEAYVPDTAKRRRIAKKIFGSYNEWLILLNNQTARDSLEKLHHSDAGENLYFKKVRDKGSVFASGLRELFFNRESDKDPIANLSLDYVGF